MDARDLLLLRYDESHGGFVDQPFAGVDPDQLRRRPHGLNPVVWLAWHVARVPDAVVGRLEAGQWVGDFWARARSRGWYLLQVGLLHPYGHWFDAMVTRGALAPPG
jgi:hypothetical protein